jgi:hypothetical protein
MRGILHLTITISFTQCNEFMTQKHKTIGQTIILVFDSASVLLAMVWF